MLAAWTAATGGEAGPLLGAWPYLLAWQLGTAALGWLLAAARGGALPGVLAGMLPALAAAAPAIVLPLLGSSPVAAALLPALVRHSPLAVLGGSLLGIDVLRLPALYALVPAAQAQPYAYPPLARATLEVAAAAAALGALAAFVRTSFASRKLALRARLDTSGCRRIESREDLSDPVRAGARG
ncbi:MAG: hypothetical protein KatS3mg102_1042 [Planctomycetota bacterium]|nr:MAG: hypothetical protein KatS3mg102_1042 [Planctomycetota bacterium]